MSEARKSRNSMGYGKLQAHAICGGIDRDMARIEDAVLRMRRRVPDHNLSADRQLEELRELAEALKAIVERRTNV